MRVFKVKRIVLHQIGVDSILFDPAVPEIFYTKHNLLASNYIGFFFGSADVDLASFATPFQF